MSVWDDQPANNLNRPPASTGQGPSAVPTPRGTDMRRAHDDVRVAAKKDAAEVIARARRDIRQIVTDARREIQEITAQVHAADVEMAESALPDPGDIEYEELPVLDADAWLGPSQADEQPPVKSVRSGTIAAPTVFAEPAGYLSSDPSRLPASGPVRTFVALFTLVGIVVLAGTVWWLGRNPAGFSSATRVDSVPLPGPDSASTPALDPSAALTPPPAPIAAPEGLLVQIDVQRPTWIRTTVDGDVDAGRTYSEGELIKIEGGTEVAVRAGDAGGLLVSVNGGPNRPFGPDGVALTRRFSRVTTPAAETSATPRPEPAPPALGAPVASVPTTVPPNPTTSAAPPRPGSDVAAVRPPAAPAPAPTEVAPPPAPATPTASAPPPSSPGPSAPRTDPPAPLPPAVSVPPVSSAAAPPSAPPPPARAAAPVRMDIAASARQWMDAYHRQDRVVMQSLTAPSLAINDERRATQRFPFGLEVTRAFEEEELHLSGDSAIFNARMTERASTGSIVSRVSQTWIRRLGQWQLQEARILADAPASSAVR